MTAPMIVQTTIQQTDYAVSVADPGSSFTVACTTEQTSYDVTVENLPGPVGPRGPAGLVMRGTWDAGTAYAVDDAVFYGGSSWWAVTANVGVQPDTDGGAHWELLAQAGTVQDVTAADSTVTVGGTAAHPTVAAHVGTTAGTVAAGDDARIVGAAQKASNLSDLASAATARANLGLGGAATLNVGTAAGTVAAGDDARFAGSAAGTAGAALSATDPSTTNARTPTGAAGGDLSGTYPNPSVAALDGVAVSGTPATGDVLTATSGTAAAWQPPTGGSGSLEPCTMMPGAYSSAPSAVSVPANNTYFARALNGGTIDRIAFLANASGVGVYVSVYSNTGNGLNARPNTQLAVSAAITCTGGVNVVTLTGGAITVQPGDWLAITIRGALTLGGRVLTTSESTYIAGWGPYTVTGNTPPATATTPAATQILPLLVGQNGA